MLNLANWTIFKTNAKISKNDVDIDTNCDNITKDILKAADMSIPI